MGSPKKQYKVTLKDDTGRFLYFGGNELAYIQDEIGKPVVHLFWEIAGVADDSDEERGVKLLRVVGDKEMLVLLHHGINGGGNREFDRKTIGNLIRTDVQAKTEYLNALVGALSMALFGKDSEDLAAEAAEKKAAENADAQEDADALPNPT